MITKYNFKEIINSIGLKKVQKELDKKHEFILMEAFIFNSGFKGQISSKNYDMELDNYASSNGQIFTHKDDFYSLLSEFGFEFD